MPSSFDERPTQRLDFVAANTTGAVSAESRNLGGLGERSAELSGSRHEFKSRLHPAGISEELAPGQLFTRLGAVLRLVLGTAFLVLLSLACRRSPDPDQDPAPAPSASSSTASLSAAPAPAPEAPGIEVIGGPQLVERLGRSQAKATIVNVWASWCGPCRREFPMLTSLSANLKQSGVDVVFVSVDEAESYPAALQFAKDNGKSPPIWIAERPLGAFKRAIHPSWKGALPATFLVDAQGHVRYFWNGPVYDNELLPVVEGFLRGEDIDGEAHLGLSPGRDMRE